MKYFDTKTIFDMSDIDLEVIKVIMIEEIERRNKVKIKEEVRKLSRPYFETKVVNVKGGRTNSSNCKAAVLCILCGEMLTHDKKGKEPKGKWINGENLDKIKFPCFCSYSDGEGSERKKGFLSMNNGYYYIANINSQKKIQNDVTDPCCKLKEFITKYNIHILKGKIIIYEEE